MSKRSKYFIIKKRRPNWGQSTVLLIKNNKTSSKRKREYSLEDLDKIPWFFKLKKKNASGQSPQISQNPGINKKFQENPNWIRKRRILPGGSRQEPMVFQNENKLEKWVWTNATDLTEPWPLQNIVGEPKLEQCMRRK